MCVPFLVWLHHRVPGRITLSFHHSIHSPDLRIFHQVLNHSVTCINFYFLFITQFFDSCVTEVQTALIQSLGPKRQTVYLRFPPVYSYSSYPPEVVRPVAYSSHARNIIVVPGWVSFNRRIGFTVPLHGAPKQTYTRRNGNWIWLNSFICNAI